MFGKTIGFHWFSVVSSRIVNFHWFLIGFGGWWQRTGSDPWDFVLVGSSGLSERKGFYSTYRNTRKVKRNPRPGPAARPRSPSLSFFLRKFCEKRMQRPKPNLWVILNSAIGKSVKFCVDWRNSEVSINSAAQVMAVSCFVEPRVGHPASGGDGEGEGIFCHILDVFL